MYRHRCHSPASQQDHVINFLVLPPEIRQMVYHHLLSSSPDIYISHSQFKRHKRLHAVPDLHCSTEGGHSRGTICPCQPIVRRRTSVYVHRNTWCEPDGQVSLPPHPSHRHGGRNGLSRTAPGILRTCRTVYAEAYPVLYAMNTFHFENANAAHALRWSSSHAVFLRSMHIVLSPIYKEWDNRVNIRADRTWAEYLQAQRFNLRADYPNLRHLTLSLGRALEVEQEGKLWNILQPFSRSLRGIPVLEIIGLNELLLLYSLTPIVRPVPPASDGMAGAEVSGSKVQMKISEYDEMPGWKNVILWWGKDGETPPVQGRPFTGDRKYRRRLYRIDMGGGKVELSAGESVRD